GIRDATVTGVQTCALPISLLGVSQGGPVGIAYAVRHPERVTHLVLYGSYCLGWANRDLPAQAEEYEAQVKLTQFGWGRNNPAYRSEERRVGKGGRCGWGRG